MSRQRRARRLLGVAFWTSVLLSSLAVVTWRQTEGLAREQAVRSLQAERAIVETERMEQERRIQALSTRQRVVGVARQRLGMHLPSDDEIVLLPIEADSLATFTSTVAVP